MNTERINTKVMVNLRDKNGKFFEDEPFEVLILGATESIRGNGDYQVVVTKIEQESDKISFYIFENEIIETL